jgi:membrane-bound metal-dependent hydrolase YbcI (DUF457 family)
MVKNQMPSPFGHVLGGVLAAWTTDLIPGSRAWRTAAPNANLFRRAGGGLTLVCAALAAAPDADLVMPFQHRTVTHGVGAVIIVSIFAAIVTGQVTGKVQSTTYNVQSKFKGHTWRIALMCAAAYASHLLFDWLAIDNNPPRGLQLFWPFSDGWFISGLDLFIQTARRRFLTFDSIRTNLTAMAWEALVLSPVLIALWLVRVKALARFATELTRRHHSA